MSRPCILTNLMATAKGGTLYGSARRAGLHIRFVGIGEQINDMVPVERINLANLPLRKEPWTE